MAQHRYRQNKIKREHTIIDGLLRQLEQIAELPHVQSITPGRINQRSGNRTEGIRFQYKTETGLKFLALSSRAVQEVFLVSDQPDAVLGELQAKGLVSTDAGPLETAPTAERLQSRPEKREPRESGESRGTRESPKDRKAAPPSHDAQLTERKRRPRRRKPKAVASDRPPSPHEAPQVAPQSAASGQQTPERQAPEQQAPNESQATEPAARPRTAHPEVQDALPDDIRERMRDMIEGKPPKPEGAKSNRSKKRSSKQGERSARGIAAATHPRESLRPGQLWHELLQRHRALQELEERWADGPS